MHFILARSKQPTHVYSKGRGLPDFFFFFNLGILGILVKVYCSQLIYFLLVGKVSSRQSLIVPPTKIYYLEAEY